MFLRSKYQVSSPPLRNQPDKTIFDSVTLGYSGFVQGVKSENVFGQTYGKTTYASAARDFHVGRDEPAHLKYTTTMKSEFINHSTV